MRVLKRGERALKRLGLLAARLVIAAPPPRPAAIDLGHLERVLVVRQDRRLGNLVLLTPLLLGLRRAAPRAAITVAAPHQFAPLLADHPAVDRLLAIDHRRLLARPWRLGSLARRLRAGRPELAIDASPHHAPSFLSGLIAWASGATVRLGYARPDAVPFLTLLAPLPAAAAHESVLVHDLLRALDPALPPAPRPQVAAPPGARDFAARTFRRLGVPAGCPLVGIHPGGRRQKRWPIAHFETVAAGLAARGLAVVVFSGPAERPLLGAMSPPGPRRIYAPPTDARGLATFLSGLDVFVSGDSGPMHLASALGVPCVTVFRVADAMRYRPLGQLDRVLHADDGMVEPEAVIAAVVDLLRERCPT